MIGTTRAFALTTAALMLVGCEEKKPVTPPAPAKAPAPTMPAVPATTGASAPTLPAMPPAATGMMADAKAKAVSAYQNTLDAAKTQMDALAAKASSIAADKKPAYDSAMQDLKSKFDGAQSKLAALKADASAAWQNLSADAQTAVDKLKSSLDSAVQQFK